MPRRLGARTFRHDLVRVAIAAGLCARAADARAGGFDIPDLGTQALGRGAAFVAKADDGTAIYYNPAGLARQRGTHLLLDGNIYASSFSFARIGSYHDDPQDAATSYGNKQFPLVQNSGGPSFAPFIALTTDFGYFDRVTFALGLFTPPEVQNRTFALASGSAPAASRYDFVQNRSSILMPTASIGVRATTWLDLGVSLHVAHASFASTSVNYAGTADCKTVEDFRCDVQTDLAATGNAFGATIGASVRPSPSVQVGLSVRTPLTFNAVGALDVATPKVLAATPLQGGAASYGTQLPLLVKLGGRYIGMAGSFEQYDLEADVVYETWGSAQGGGPVITAPSLGSLSSIQIVDQHGYSNTYGLRLGGSYNVETGSGLFTLRGGAYYDSSATAFQFTRIDWDTLAKFAGTVGAGYQIGAFQFDLGYAAVASAPRLVGSGIGAYSPPDLEKSGKPTGTTDIVNEGAYRGFTHILSLGISIAIDGFFGAPRKSHYGKDWEQSYGGEKTGGEEEPKPDENAVPAEDKPVEAPKPVEVPKPVPVEVPKPVEAPKPVPVEPPPPPADDNPIEVLPARPGGGGPKRVPPPKKEPPPRKRPPPEPEPEPEPAPPPKKRVASPPDDEKPVEKKPVPPKEEKAPKKRKEWWEEN